MIMEYFPDGVLVRKFTKYNKFTTTDANHILYILIRSLAFLTTNHFVFGKVNPNNIFLV